jgi:Tripartite tricarboxylate transporter family receptor
VVFTTYSTASEQLSAGTLRALATASPTRIEPLPDVPTVAESGYKDYEMSKALRVAEAMARPDYATDARPGSHETGQSGSKLAIFLDHLNELIKSLKTRWNMKLG